MLELYEDESGKSRGKLDYKLALLLQTDRVMRLSATIPFTKEGHHHSNEQDIQKAYKAAIANLEALLYPYLDKTYKNDLKALKGPKDYTYRMNQFGLLIALMHRKALLLEEIGIEEIGKEIL